MDRVLFEITSRLDFKSSSIGSGTWRRHVDPFRLSLPKAEGIVPVIPVGCEWADTE